MATNIAWQGFHNGLDRLEAAYRRGNYVALLALRAAR